VDPKKRLTARKLLLHPFLDKQATSPKKQSNSITKRLTRLKVPTTRTYIDKPVTPNEDKSSSIQIEQSSAVKKDKMQKFKFDSANDSTTVGRSSDPKKTMDYEKPFEI
jgi:hypothetical protein